MNTKEIKLTRDPNVLLPSEVQSLRDELHALQDSRDRHRKTLTLAIMDIQMVMSRLETKLCQLRKVRDEMIDEQQSDLSRPRIA